jgi:hypothetical protein
MRRSSRPMLWNVSPHDVASSFSATRQDMTKPALPRSTCGTVGHDFVYMLNTPQLNIRILLQLGNPVIHRRRIQSPTVKRLRDLAASCASDVILPSKHSPAQPTSHPQKRPRSTARYRETRNPCDLSTSYVTERHSSALKTLVTCLRRLQTKQQR